MQQNYNVPMMQPNQYDRMAQLQNYNQNLQQQFPSMQPVINQNPVHNVGINGKFIQVVENITANDVPMDGSVAVFPKQDMSEIICKAWQADGTIRTVFFKPVLEEQPDNLPQMKEKLKFDISDASTEVLMKRFDDITERLEKMEKSMSKQTSRTKKEADE